MRLTVRLFGPLSRAAGRAEVCLPLDDAPATCAALRRRLSECEPRLAPWLAGCRFAVNCQFAAEDQPLRADDEIALVGFVSGG